MALYHLSDMVRMRREALGITQDKLIEIPSGAVKEDNIICSTDTLRRIEQGKVTRVKSDVFKKIMKRLHTLPERVYASLFVTTPQALNIKSEIHIHICINKDSQAEKELEKLETMLVSDYPRNQQYLVEKKAILAYRQGKLGTEKYLEILWDALRLTVPVLDQIDLAKWPFNRAEFDILSDIGNAYSDMDDMEKEFKLLLKLKENVERKYMDCAYYIVWHMRVLGGLSQLMCITQRYGEALEYCKVGMEECKKWYILGQVYHFLYDTVWSREQQIKKEDWIDRKSTRLNSSHMA